VTEGTYAQTKPLEGGYTVLELPSREAALEWTAKIAVACRCAQEVRRVPVRPRQLATVELADIACGFDQLHSRPIASPCSAARPRNWKTLDAAGLHLITARQKHIRLRTSADGPSIALSRDS